MNEMKLTWWEHFTLFWTYEFHYYPRNFVQGVRNLIKWFPVIWMDRNWDDSYLWTILKFKISEISKSHGKAMPYVGYERNVEVMNLINRLIEKIQSEDYLHEYFDYQDVEVTFVPIEGTDMYEMKQKVLEDNLDEYFKKYPLTYKQAFNHHYYQDEPTREVLAMAMSDIRHKKAHRIIFELLNQNLPKWWE